MDELLRWRDEFPILSRSTYMISNSLGAMPRGVEAQMRAYTEIWATRGVRAWEEGWWELPMEVGNAVGAIIGAGPGEVSVHQNVTTAQAIIASCFDFSGPRNKIVMVEADFPSVQYFYHQQQRRGARFELIESGDALRIPLEKVLAAIDERTLLAPISLVLFRSAYIVNAKAIIEKAHKVGAHVVLDVFQAAGTVPVNVRALGADFAVGGVLKWLCGGPGVGYLYVREDLQKKMEPMFTGWFAHKRPFHFEPGGMDRTEDALRFMNGTTHIPALYAARPGLEIIRKVGVEAIRAKSQRQTERLVDIALTRGWRVNTSHDSAERGGTVSIFCPCAREVCRELLARDVLVDFRPGAGIRFSPHFYNKDEEIDFALDQVSDILATRAWERHAQPAAAAQGGSE